jgi:hypothetical protein
MPFRGETTKGYVMGLAGILVEARNDKQARMC